MGNGLQGLLLALTLLCATASEAESGSWQGLQGLTRVAVEVTVAAQVPGLSVAELERRIEAALSRSQAAPTADRSSAERLRLMVGVEAYSSAELRGFYLPFSGRYGIGPVRLIVERPVTLPGIPTPVRAVVWQAERLTKGPWRRAATEVLGLLDELIVVFLNDYWQAPAR